MAYIDNRGVMPCAFFEKTGPGGQVYDVLTVRGAFDFPESREQNPTLTPATVQPPFIWGDEHAGPIEHDPMRAVLKGEGDAVLFKPNTDLHITGRVRTQDAKPVPTWLCRVTLGKHQKTLKLYGPRYFERGFIGWKLTAPDNFSELELDYRHAFGGCFTIPANDREGANWVGKPDNPAGCGWLPDTKALKPLSRRAKKNVRAQIDALRRMPAPRIEDPLRPVKHPKNSLPAEGFAPIARWWQPRLSHAGTYDDAWQKERYPQLPDDFDPAFYQSAHPDLILPGHLKGNEAILLQGMLPEGPCSIRLPGVQTQALLTLADNSKHLPPLNLDTLRIDLDARQVVLVWRAAFARGAQPIKEIAVGQQYDLNGGAHG